MGCQELEPNAVEATNTSIAVKNILSVTVLES
jgi:hypothetical protein